MGVSKHRALFNPHYGKGQYRDHMVISANRSVGEKKIYEVSWRYMGSVEAGDVWVFDVHVPVAEELDEHITKAVVYDGTRLVLYDDPNLTLILKPGESEVQS